MADATLQELRRRVASTGAVDDRAALLRARVRAGELALDRLWLPAFLGDEAARAALGPQEHLVLGGELCCCGDLDVHHDPINDGHSPVHACEYYGTPCDCVLEDRTEYRPRIWPDRAALAQWVEWPRGHWTNEVRVRALCAVAAIAVPEWERRQERESAADPPPPWRARAAQLRAAPRRAWITAETWLLRPTTERVRAADFAAGETDGLGPGSVAAWAAARIASGDHPLMPRLPGRADRCTAGLCRDADLIGEDAVREALRRELIPWALGERDPVAERVAARG